MARTHQALAPLKIIVVDDVSHLRDLTVEAVCRMGHDARGIASGDVLAMALNDFAPDTLILDLPGGEGRRIAKHMREAFTDMGIVMLVAQFRVDDKVAAYESGVNFYLTKPVSWRELGAVLDAGAHACIVSSGSRVRSS